VTEVGMTRSEGVMTVAVASGKGGTGKTLVATNLAAVASSGQPVLLADLDVDEPNCHLYFDGLGGDGVDERVMVPTVDAESCRHCGLCGDVCAFHAIVDLGAVVRVYPELCHGCHACLELCPEGAIAAGEKVIGRTFVNHRASLTLVTGQLAIGQPATTPMVAATKRRATEMLRTGAPKDRTATLQILDAPPGSSCPVIEAVQGVDHVLLVAEPTRFGLHDLARMDRTLRRLGVPFSVVVNKGRKDTSVVEDYCEGRAIAVHGRVPWSREIAATAARGRLVVDLDSTLRQRFESLLVRVVASARGVAGGVA
jgi:MinD superfamily P-loop ATPase